MSPASRLFDDLLRAGPVLLTGPVGPDGDSLGACLALERALAARGVDVRVTGEVSFRYAWMPGSDRILPDEQVSGSRWAAVVVLDGDRHRLPPGVLRAFESAEIRAIVDHHASTRDDGYTHYWVDPGAGSTCEMLYRSLPSWGIPLDRPLAELLYAGVIFDTGGFRYSNTRPDTHEMAAALLRAGVDHTAIAHHVLMDRRPSGLRLAGEVYASARFELGGRVAVGAVTLEQGERLRLQDGDLEGLVEALLQVHGVEVAVLMIDRLDGGLKLSFRSRGLVDVARTAQALTARGGGHAKAAGASFPASERPSPERVLAAVAASF